MGRPAVWASVFAFMHLGVWDPWRLGIACGSVLADVRIMAWLKSG